MLSLSLRHCFTSLTSSYSSRTQFLALSPQRIHTFCCCAKPSHQNGFISDPDTLQSSSPSPSPLFSGMEDALMSYLCGKKKATDLAHMVWKHVVKKGDMVVDATCGNGFDTLAMLNLVADDSRKGYVYALDIQKDALDNTSILLEESLNSDEKQLVKLYNICHSKMEEVVPKNASVREELEAVETFAARMPVENWICCKLHMLNRPYAPVPIFLFRR
ncbi:hypothetical protein PIB30_030576 [Stylosanthes scabra]|uniref:Uncharacterized protein n=1 Tax=Stylosanthes scabra TaxID=79078 RepID=A0ABU6TDR7_9FABA|nr:hypothetical protein [Stylosanthes scabra]